MSTKKLSRPAMDMEEEVESTSGQVHGGKQSTKEMESRERKDDKTVSRNLKLLLARVLQKRPLLKSNLFSLFSP